MDVDAVTSPQPSQSTEDIEHEAKSARSQRIVMGRRRRLPEDWRVPDRFRTDVVTKTNYPMDEEDLALVERARVISQLFRDPAHRARLAIGIKKDDKVFAEKTGEEQRGAGHLQRAEELKPPCKEYATPNLKTDGNFSESQSLPEQALSCLKNRETEYCMSDKFIDKLDKKAKLYFSKMKQHSEKEIIENGRQFMKDQAFAAYRYYIADNDLFEAFDYQFGELLHHCFTIEGYAKVYHHYNFTIEMKANDENDWTSALFFAEVKLMHGVKYYFCSPLELTDHEIHSVHVLVHALEVPVIHARSVIPLNSSTRLEVVMLVTETWIELSEC